MPLSKLFCPINAALSVKRERRKEARPGELLDAALDLFVEKGFAATRAEEVAARAGVSKGTLFLYFQSKEELLKAVVEKNVSSHFKDWNIAFDSFEGDSATMVGLLLAACGDDTTTSSSDTTPAAETTVAATDTTAATASPADNVLSRYFMVFS